VAGSPKGGIMNWVIFLKILILIESGGDPDVIGDRNLKHKAYGVYQIRQPYVDDVNDFYRDRVLKKFKRIPTAKDMKDTAMATWYVKMYLHRWSTVFEKRNGRKPTWAEMARMHNGGPNGYRRKSTYPYLRKYLKARKGLLE